MQDPYLLHIFSPDRHVSPFDVNMAYEAHYDAVVPYANVTLEDTTALTQDTIFSRGPQGARRTAIFIGGRDLGIALSMFEAAREAMVEPFVVSLFTDPSGAITTAAAVVAMLERRFTEAAGEGLAGRRLAVFGGTGPVGICVGVMAARRGAEVTLVSHQHLGAAQKVADDYNRRLDTQMRGADGSTEAAVAGIVAAAEAVVNCARAGVRVLSAAQLAGGAELRVAADVNAVPPSGIEGIGLHDKAAPLECGRDARGIGALAIGDVKYKVHTRLLQKMYEADEPLRLSIEEALATALELA